MKNYNFLGTTQGAQIYIGQNAGRQLYDEIVNAKDEVLILSPYIDELKLNDLFELQSKGVDVTIGFSDLSNDRDKAREERLLKSLINRERIFNNELEVQKVTELHKIIRLKRIVIYIKYFFIFLLLLSIYNKLGFLIYLSILFLFVLLHYYSIHLENKRSDTQRIKTYNYKYQERLNFKYFRNYKFIHSKLYIIDKRVAYIGSLNFTTNGFETNFETRIKIEAQDEVDKLRNFVIEVFSNKDDFPRHQIDFLGSRLLDEY